MGAPPLPWPLQTLVEQMASGTATPRLEAVRCGSAPSSLGVGTKVTNEQGHGIGGDPPSSPQHMGGPPTFISLPPGSPVHLFIQARFSECPQSQRP